VTSTGVVTTLSGTGVEGNKDGFMDTATFSYPSGMAMDSQGNLFVTDLNGNTIRKITPMGIVSTFAGSTSMAQGTTDGTGTAARFFSPAAIAIDGNDNIYIADGNNSLIRKITPAGVVTTFAGSGTPGSADGNGTAASFNYPFGLVIDPNGNLYVTDIANNNIRKITPAGDVSTFAGSGIEGSTDGSALSARFSGPIGIVRDQSGNFYVLEQTAAKIRMITSGGMVVTLAGGDVNSVSVDGAGKFAGFSFPRGITMDPDGSMYVTDSYSSVIRKIVVQ
jgi:sugar lactone lactonase YvrE